ncbi:uncharacterized protein CXorf38 homolog isoform X1 [Eleutherodactylus coqui]|uniref:Uncharacterized protein n=1 Tax=Eleutherodactylus coqui TaxID=57060 RepID=A0A8J6KE73_ELECQ|nr:hypothetical protein GDO78_008632 [Eleutherodactylus coqui]
MYGERLYTREALPGNNWASPGCEVNMAQSGLLARLNCREYKNWMKAGHCLLMLQCPLQGYIQREMLAFHQLLAARIRGPTPRRRCQCRAKGKEFQPGCPVCVQWKELILAHHNNRDGEIHWGNSNPSLWPTDYWEVAKVYMPRGQAQKRSPQNCDAAALLNLINTCDYFRIRNRLRVREIIKCRNELMHSSDMMVSSPWLEAFGQKMHDLTAEFTHVPGIVREGERMQEILLSDWNVDKFEIDGIIYAQGPSDIFDLPPYAVEIRLIAQLFQELYLDVEEQGSLTEENENQASKMKKFLSQNEDLKFAFQVDLEWLESVWKNPVPLHGEGWTPTLLSAAVFVAISLALTAIFLHLK